MLPANEFEQYSSPLPPKLQNTYSDFKLINESQTSLLYNAKSLLTEEIHAIRVLNINSQLVKENYDLVSTLFIQELL